MSFCDNAAAHSRSCAEPSIAPVSTRARPGACAHNRPGAAHLHNTDIRTHDTAPLNPHQCDKEDNRGWTFEEVLVASLLPFLGLWAGVPVIVSASYVRGLLISPSHILQKSLYFSIIYSDASQP